MYQRERIQQIPVDLGILGHCVPIYSTGGWRDAGHQPGGWGAFPCRVARQMARRRWANASLKKSTTFMTQEKSLLDMTKNTN